jgi:flavin reductase
MVDATTFKSGMRRLAAGVTVVAACENGLPSGIVITSVSSVSAEPVPSMLICINRSSSCHDVIIRSGAFCANILCADDVSIAQRFSSPAHREKRFEGSGWTTLATGSPALPGALVSFDCAVAKTVEINSHTIFIGNVRDMRLWKEVADPLLYFEGGYRDFKSATHNNPPL